MTNTAVPSSRQPVELTDQLFARIAAMALDRYGLYLQPSKRSLVQSRLTRRLGALNLSGFDDYLRILEKAGDSSEEQHLLSALTTNVTQFFREAHHFDFLENRLADHLSQKASNGQPVRIWCAACSTGQEPYSVAAALLSAQPMLAKLDVRILATDIDQKVVDQARLGQYPADLRTEIPTKYAAFFPIDPQSKSILTVSTELRSMVHFATLNLVADWPMKHAFDVIVCRNVAIYFNAETQQRIWSRFAGCLLPRAILMIGHSERLSGPAKTHFSNVGITTYQRN